MKRARIAGIAVALVVTMVFGIGAIDSNKASAQTISVVSYDESTGNVTIEKGSSVDNLKTAEVMNYDEYISLSDDVRQELISVSNNVKSTSSEKYYTLWWWTYEINEELSEEGQPPAISGTAISACSSQTIEEVLAEYNLDLDGMTAKLHPDKFYTFDHWYAVENGDQRIMYDITPDTKISDIAYLADANSYISIAPMYNYNKPETVTVTLTGDFVIPRKYVTFTGAELALPTPECSGKTFMGWYDVNGVKYTNAGDLNADTTLYAKWE